jgi:hypothetical protein
MVFGAVWYKIFLVFIPSCAAIQHAGVPGAKQQGGASTFWPTIAIQPIKEVPSTASIIVLPFLEIIFSFSVLFSFLSQKYCLSTCIFVDSL